MLQTDLLRVYFLFYGYIYEENIEYVVLALLYIQKGSINKQAMGIWEQNKTEHLL